MVEVCANVNIERKFFAHVSHEQVEERILFYRMRLEEQIKSFADTLFKGQPCEVDVEVTAFQASVSCTRKLDRIYITEPSPGLFRASVDVRRWEEDLLNPGFGYTHTYAGEGETVDVALQRAKDLISSREEGWTW